MLNRSTGSATTCTNQDQICASGPVLLLSASAALQGFKSVYKPRRTGRVSFAELLDSVAGVSPELRIRFTSPHPKDFSDEVLRVRAGLWARHEC